jgi:hypothetical protein
VNFNTDERLMSMSKLSGLSGKYTPHSFLGGLLVIVLATGPKVRGFKPGQGDAFLRAIKSAARLPSEEK